MPGDVTPRITRTSSLFTPWSTGAVSSLPTTTPRPQSTPGIVASSSGEKFIPTAAGWSSGAVPSGYELDRLVPGGMIVRPKAKKPEAPTPSGFYTQFLNDQLSRRGPDGTTLPPLAGTSTAVNGVLLDPSAPAKDQQTQIATNGQASSVFGPLNLQNILPDSLFLFDHRAPIDPATGQDDQRQAAALFLKQAKSSDPSVPASENMMTISAGVLFLRNLAARDKAAYNQMVVLLRNAGYGSLPQNDAELPLNGYSQQVGAAFAYAANDLAQANQGGDQRDITQYLIDRGQGYADYVKQQAADAAIKAQYQPVDRKYQDPSTLRLAAKSAAETALGRKLSAAEEAKFEAAYRAKEDTFYNQIDAAGRAHQSFSGYAPDTMGQANDFIQGDQFQQEATANRIGTYAQSFIKLMGG